MKSIKLIIGFIFLLLIGSCRESFEAPITPSNIRLLVVEGYLNVKGKSFFKLSRTRRLGDSRANTI